MMLEADSWRCTDADAGPPSSPGAGAPPNAFYGELERSGVGAVRSDERSGGELVTHLKVYDFAKLERLTT